MRRHPEPAKPLTRKLERFVSLEVEDRRRLEALSALPVQTFRRGQSIAAEGEKPSSVHLIVSGMAARARVLENGQRQLMALLIPGDLCDVEVFVLEAMDHDIVALADTACALIPARRMEEMLTESSSLTRALWWSTMLDTAVLREWIVGHGRRGARERIAHLFYELLLRYCISGAGEGFAIPFPLTQSDLADATGLTPVHVNRTLQELRALGLVELERKRLHVTDPDGLRRIARFESNYLHLGRPGQPCRRRPSASDLMAPPAAGREHDHQAR